MPAVGGLCRETAVTAFSLSRTELFVVRAILSLLPWLCAVAAAVRIDVHRECGVQGSSACRQWLSSHSTAVSLGESALVSIPLALVTMAVWPRLPRRPGGFDAPTVALALGWTVFSLTCFLDPAALLD